MVRQPFRPFTIHLRKPTRTFLRLSCAALALSWLCVGTAKGAPKDQEKIEEINNEFHFLGPDDTVLVHEEDGKLKGQINVYAGEEESDAVLSYIFTIGTRVQDRVEFKTSKVHEKYYRFAGNVQRGSGHNEGDPDYLRLVGDLEIVTVNGMTGKETREQKQVVLKSLGADEIED
jgi:hypothetical protein